MRLYIDPGTGSMLFTVLIGLIGAAFYGFRKLIIKLQFLFSGGTREKEPESRIPIVLYSDDKRYWNTFGPICRELEKRREKDVFDNTRIIIVSDHGYCMGLRDDWKLPYENKPDSEDHSDIMFYNPVLMVKDFGASEFTVDQTFMTNADTPSIAVSGLLDNAANPFTGKIIAPVKGPVPQMVFLSDQYHTDRNYGTTYKPDFWASVSGDMFDIHNWKVIPPEELP